MTLLRLTSFGMLLILCTDGAADVLLKEDFSQPRRLTVQGAKCWELEPRRLRFVGTNAESRVLTNLDGSDQLTMRVPVKLTKRTGPNWATAGLGLFEDLENHWRLLLVESPEGRRYLELIERYRGLHQAQNQPPQSGTSLPSKFDGKLDTWEYGKRYELVLSVTPETICGEVREVDTGKFWRKTYSFTTRKAVRKGRPALSVAGFQGEFGVLTAEGILPKPMKLLTVEPGREGGVLLLPGEDGTAAKTLEGIFQRAGYGTSVVSWEEFDGAKISVDRVDLLVLADARRLPDTCKTPVLSFFRSGGKLMAIGAPAFGEILSKTPQGWATKERYGEALLQTLDSQSAAFAPGDWHYSALNADLPFSAEPHGDAEWKFGLDLKGWGTFGKKLEHPAPEEYGALTFHAKGDDRTPQLSIECRETDGSRWIATVDLTESWKGFLLGPLQFPNWPDSPAKRGGPGDRLNFQNVTDIRFGLSRSHTPKCEPGEHTFWVRDVGWAKFQSEREPDFSPPEIEMISPSYKLYPLWETASVTADKLKSGWKTSWKGKGYSPVWREGGRGFDRQRAWRWIPLAEALDERGRKRGALISLMIGDYVNYGALWANVAVADPADALRPPLVELMPLLAQRMTGGCFLLEAGSRLFSSFDGEEIELGATVVNPSRTGRSISLLLLVKDEEGKELFKRSFDLQLSSREIMTKRCVYSPQSIPLNGLRVETIVLENDKPIDRIAHRVDRLPSGPAPPEEFVKVDGSNFRLGKDKWFMLGVNYRPNFIGGYPTLDVFQRCAYDPTIIERDLSGMESMGINFLSAIHALQPPRPDDPASYRDMLDFLNRCRQHGMKVFYFLPWGNPFLSANVEAIKKHIEVSGIKDHPAILAWELAWEPIYSFGKRKRLPDLRAEWTRWIEQRYGSVANAERDWGFSLEPKEGLVSIPTAGMCTQHGDWDRAVAAFRRFYSDYVSQLYQRIVNDLRAFDAKHLITFRGGACGIPTGARFAHLHSVGVAKHIDFLCPEGYNLKAGMGQPTPSDDLRKGGLVTLYYRFVSREKPVVWMEFGYTVNGFRGTWETDMVHISRENLSRQKAEYEDFYKMFLESGARGAAPWWLPGGFRLGENSDFGIFNCDGTERPCCEVMRKYMPMFKQVVHESPTAFIDLDLDAHYPDAWDVYGEQYLELVKADQRPYVKTAGTGTDSSDTPLVAVGDVPYNGHNPPIYLNAEFNSLEISHEEGKWRDLNDNDVIEVKRGSKILCKASIGNIGEAKWLAPRDDLKEGAVYLGGRKEYGIEFKAPITQDTDYLHDAEVKPFVLIPSLDSDAKASFEMLAEGRMHFGERRRITIKVKE